MTDAHSSRPPRGRPPATTARAIAREALALFDARGYEEVTADEVAEACGIARRTLFRYFDTKADLVWGEFDAELRRFAEALREAPADVPVGVAIARGVVATNHFGAGALDELRIRMRLISTVPALVAHSALRYEAWLSVVAAFVAERRGGSPGDLPARAIARASLGAAIAGFEAWARDGEGDPSASLEAAFAALGGEFDAGAATARS